MIGLCELLGFCFNRKVKPSFSLRGFRMRSEDNPHGWGLAFYPDESVQVYKEPCPSKESPLSQFLENYEPIGSRIIISHIRRISRGEESHRNTHPFQREWNGRDYVFAHNGTLYIDNPEGGRYKPVGTTDSEIAFCHIMNRISEEGVKFRDDEDYKWLWSVMNDINGYGDFNCLLSDGKHLFSYHDIEGYKGLYQLHRKAPYGPVELLDDDYQIDLAHEKKPDQEGYIIASRPLTSEKWEVFIPGELRVYRDGKLIFRVSEESI
ncbi:class II glutamine amidotransferase [Methanothermobacter sp. KEPCO-1]|uniref:class II glutamine amidotransferase n=1 Tax=Methanothermobacter sp. KEPCO-1 TaxID=2603820 RepID=UPI0021029248|nr:class II glutamine amidotransferase [Methanothermobacter sp. KEPCO-1]